MSLPQINTPVHELKIPSTGKKVKYRPFVVREEKILLLALESENQEEVTDAIVQIIGNCIQTKIDLDSLSTFDIEYIFLNVRAKSVGEILEFAITCPDDGETQADVEINIDDIQVVKSKDHSDTIDLENGYFIKMKYPTMKYIMDKNLMIRKVSLTALLNMLLNVLILSTTMRRHGKQQTLQRKNLKSLLSR